MAVTNAGSTPLTFTNLPIGVQVTKITDTSADWASVANSTYFYDKGDGLVHYKNSSGVVLELFSAGGLTYFTEAQATASPNDTVYVDSLTAISSTTNADFAIRPKGTGAILASIPDSTATGGNKRGAGAVDLQTSRANANEVAAGQYSVIAGGRYNRANGAYSFAAGNGNIASGGYAFAFGSANNVTSLVASVLGESNTVSGNYAVAIGLSNTASGSSAFAIGGQANIANGNFSYAMGVNAGTFGITSRLAHGYGFNSVNGETQYSKFILGVRTTGNTATTLTVGGGAAAATNQVILSNQSAYRFKGTIVGKQSGSVNAAVWDIDGFIVRGANAAATTLNISNVTLVENTPAWGTPTLAADTTNGGLQVQVTGASATNIQWTAVIETTEVIYA